MTTKTRFTSSRIVLISLTASLFSVTAQADLLGVNPLALPAHLNLSQNLRTAGALTTQPGPLETSLANAGQAVDNILPIGFGINGRRVGLTADQIADIQAMERMRDRIMAAIDMGAAFDSEGVQVTLDATEDGIDILGSLIENANLPLNSGQAVGNLLHGVSDTIGSARGLLHSYPHNPYPISSTLENLTGTLAFTTDALFHGGNQLQPLLGAQTTALNSNAGLLAPVTNLVGGLTGGLAINDAANGELLTPVTNLVGGLTGGLGGDTTNGGLLAPVIGVVDGLLATASIDVNASDNAGAGGSARVTGGNNGDLLAPVSSLLGGLLGGTPR